jgi:hypothetical protein
MRRIESSNKSSPIFGPTSAQYHTGALHLVFSEGARFIGGVRICNAPGTVEGQARGRRRGLIPLYVTTRASVAEKSGLVLGCLHAPDSLIAAGIRNEEHNSDEAEREQRDDPQAEAGESFRHWSTYPSS